MYFFTETVRTKFELLVRLWPPCFLLKMFEMEQTKCFVRQTLAIGLSKYVKN